MSWSGRYNIDPVRPGAVWVKGCKPPSELNPHRTSGACVSCARSVPAELLAVVRVEIIAEPLARLIGLCPTGQARVAHVRKR